MVTTTSYGTWTTVVEPYSAGLDHAVAEALGSYGSDYDIDALATEYRAAVNDALPPHVALTGDEFIGPAYENDSDFAGYPTTEDGALDLKAIVDSIDFWVIAARHDRTA